MTDTTLWAQHLTARRLSAPSRTQSLWCLPRARARADWLAAGKALQRLLQAGVRLGLQASYLNQPVQVAALRPKLQQITGRPGHVQLLLRIGVPTQTMPAAPRRPLADVLTGTNGLADPQ